MTNRDLSTVLCESANRSRKRRQMNDTLTIEDAGREAATCDLIAHDESPAIEIRLAAIHDAAEWRRIQTEMMLYNKCFYAEEPMKTRPYPLRNVLHAPGVPFARAVWNALVITALLLFGSMLITQIWKIFF